MPEKLLDLASERWPVALVVAALILVLLAVARTLIHRKYAASEQGLARALLFGTRFDLLALFTVLVGTALLFPDWYGWIKSAALAVILLQVAIWGNVVLVVWEEQYQRRHLELNAEAVTTMHAAAFMLRIVVYSVLVLVALDNIPGVDITALVAGLGIGGIAIALAVQNILADLFASLSITLDKPFVIGDFITVGEYMGSVERIGLKTTRIRSLSGEQLVFANDDLLRSRIRNYKRMNDRRVVFSLGVTYETPSEKLAAIPTILREIVESVEQTRFDRAHFKSYGDYALEFEVVYFVLSPDYGQYMDIQQTINLAIFSRFEEESIVFAYPTQTVYWRHNGAFTE